MDSGKKIADIERIVAMLADDFGYTPVIGSEIEFYFADGDESKDNDILALVMMGCREKGIEIEKMDSETGHRQYEIALRWIADPVLAVEWIDRLKEIISFAAGKMGSEALFAAKPFEDQPGCGLHINISMFGEDKHSLFAKKGEEDETEIMQCCIGGLCATMLESMVFFAPLEESYARFTTGFNKVEEGEPLRQYNNAPVNISWGGNNRTVALRIPTSTLDAEMRHIEHRVAGADADVGAVIAAILAGIHYGLKHQIQPPHPKLYGNAFDKQYSRLPPLPDSLQSAQVFNEDSSVLETYFNPEE